MTIECRVGDIARQTDITAVVNAANAQLAPGGGVAGALHGAAGPGLYEECRPLAPIEPGQAVITGGHHLPNRYVIHCLGPVYGVDVPSDALLASCYEQALELAEAHEIESMAFPAISTGVFGYPMEEAAQVAARAVAGKAPRLQHVRLVRFVFVNDRDRQIYQDALDAARG